ncbi:MAG: aldo/keto reductase [Pseudomonadota bacterium]
MRDESRNAHSVPTEGPKEGPTEDPSATAPVSKHPSMNRRRFLQLGAATTGVAGTLGIPASLASTVDSAPPSQKTTHKTTHKTTNETSNHVRHYATLGRTGLRIADISFGSSRLRAGQEHLVSHALDRGVNYIDTAESYTDTTSETVIGRAIKGRRDDVILATKTHAAANATSESIMRSLEGSLRRLGTDRVEIFFNHAVNDVNKLQNPEWFEFAEKAKQQGKIRFTGISGHAGRLVDVVNYAAENDLVDVMLLAQNFGQDPEFYERFTRSFDFVANLPALPQAMRKAKEKGIGIIAMKVLRGARLNDMRPFEKGGRTYAQAAFKWTLSNPDVDAAIISMKSTDNIDEYLGASGDTQVTAYDESLLRTYASLTDLTYCRHACNDCAGSCPYGVDIADVLRTRMYAVDYADLEFARDEYQRITTDASACLGCSGEPCQNACTHEINIAKLCAPTHQMLA